MTTLHPARYSLTAIILHWAIAALLLLQIGLGWGLEDLPKGVAQFAGFQFHKSIGITILVLSLARLGIRLVKPRPAPVQDSKPQMWLASAVHFLLYVVMIAGPLTGWIIISTSKIRLQTMLFGTIPLPDLPVGRALHEPAESLHGAIGTVGFVLIVLHIAGALYHHFKREDVIGRMLPAGIATHKGIGVAALIAIVLGGIAVVAGRTMSFGASPQPVAAPVDAPASEVAVEPSEDAPLPSPSAIASDVAITAKATPWKLEQGGRLGFTTSYTGDAIKGSFSRWNAAIVFDPADLPGSSIKVTIDLASVESGDGQRDDMLKSDSFFGVATSPNAQFTSTSIREAGAGRYLASGTLSLHGKTRPMTVRFNLRIDGDRATASGSATLPRLAFGVGQGEWSSTEQIPDAVAIEFSLRARRQP
ncbi:cytochrome b561/polyisoprenoid-binding protein YceI [Novosphingobium hassiacum]|uniref:Cytochrome b561/polyisoprenoid-binding protein YceI n=1 Tax=Novosphingobium hassiacum TaxID=173676 RepID=A0A7W5ZZ39_9SPHN|nr:cytochrome b/b6 domain-containing protein [Novosphingobium hassiacum]MBB3860325.1 cytochrome b561/polyisoprenoid-binding protein YceI [Novosphingobium hassiacum]